MKILFINSEKYDYLQDILFSGLRKVLGQRSLVEYPWNQKYHLPIKKYPKNLGFSSTGLLQSIFRSKSKLDAVILGACKPDVFKRYVAMAESLSADVPVVLIDGGDRREIGGDLKRLGAADLWHKAMSVRPFDYIFKREYEKGRDYESHVKPLQFAWNPDRAVRSIGPMRYEFGFWAAESHAIRSSAFALLKGHFDCDLNGTSTGENMYSYKRRGKEYLRELGRTKVSLSLRGGGFDTLRYWEIPAMQSMLMSEPPDIYIPNDFVHEETAVFCQPDLSDLIDLGSYYLKHDDKRQVIAQKGRQHLLQFHTDIERAKAVLKVLE